MGSCLSNPTKYKSNSNNKEQTAQKTDNSKQSNSIPALTPETPAPEVLSSPEKSPFQTNMVLSKQNQQDEKEDFSSFGPTQRACFGAGCYWGTEKYFRHSFTKKFPNSGRIIEGKVGFMGPDSAPANPTYRQVCEGDTGHVEVYDFEFAGGAAYYEELVKYFFQFHDPTTFNRQGNDQGTQYASVIYCYTDEQYDIAHKVKNQLQQLLNTGELKPFKGKTVVTDIRRSTKFYPAHEEHQDYLAVNPNGYCNHRIRFNDWPVSN